MTAAKRKTARKTTRRTTRRPPTRARRAPARPALPTSFEELGETAVETGRNLWLAGLGLAATTMESAGGAFDALVARGRGPEPKALKAARSIGREARRTAGELAEEAARASKQKIDEALDALGVDSRSRPKNLLHRLGDLAEAIL